MLKYYLSIIYGVAEHWVHRIRKIIIRHRLTLIFNGSLMSQVVSGVT